MKIERGMLRNGLLFGIVYQRRVHNDFDNKDYSKINICLIACYICISWVKINKKFAHNVKKSHKTERKVSR